MSTLDGSFAQKSITNSVIMGKDINSADYLGSTMEPVDGLVVTTGNVKSSGHDTSYCDLGPEEVEIFGDEKNFYKHAELRRIESRGKNCLVSYRFYDSYQKYQMH